MDFRGLSLTGYGVFHLVSTAILCVPVSVNAAPGDKPFILQQQRQQALEEQLTPPVPDIHLSPSVSVSGQLVFPAEAPCFRIHDVTLTGKDEFPHWLPLQRLASQAVGRCLGAQGVNLLMSTLQNRMISHGWTTSRVLAPAQDLKSGHLQLAVIPGKIRHVRLAPGNSHWLWLAGVFPAHDGNLLDLRDIEQGLENLQRLPTVQAQMDILPAEQPGESDIIISRQQRKFWRLGVSVDDSGTTSTGRYQGGLQRIICLIVKGN